MQFTVRAREYGVFDRYIRHGKVGDDFGEDYLLTAKISGFINMRYQYNGESNSFDIRRARLDFTGTLATKLDYRFQTEFAGSPKILDAYLRYKIDRRFNLQAGVGAKWEGLRLLNLCI